MVSTECDVKVCEEIGDSILSQYKVVRKFVIGRTACHRNMVAYNIGNGDGLLICSAFHGMERITSAMSLKFLSDVCRKMKNNSTFANFIMQKGLTVVPMVNPDGVEISVNGVNTAGEKAEFVSECLVRAGMPHTKWQANACGVDINHNFDAGFEKVKENEYKMGITAPSHTRYGGKFPESERETKAVCDLCRRNNFSIAVALHTQGREIYYDYGGCTPKNSFLMAQEMSALSGYEVSSPVGIAVGGGFKDWFIEKFHRPAFTLEIGKGINPLSSEIFNTEYPLVSNMLWYLLSKS